MEKQIPGFITYLMQVKNASKSTMSSYERDLKRLAAFLAAKGIHAPEDVTVYVFRYILCSNGILLYTIIHSFLLFFHFVFSLRNTAFFRCPHYRSMVKYNQIHILLYQL